MDARIETKLEQNAFILDDVNVEINSLRYHFNSFISPYSLGAQYLIKNYVSEGELFMFQNDLDVDMLQDEIMSCFED
jgi:hypothetical protein